MANKNHYDQGGLGPLVNPGSQRKKKYNGSPRIFVTLWAKKAKLPNLKMWDRQGQNVNTKNNHRLNANDFWYALWVINIFISSV